MITKEEYLAALTIVEAYHEQLNTAISLNRRTEPTVQDFIENADISTRLKYGLAGIIKKNSNKTVLLNEIKELELSIARNIGRQSVREFTEKRNRFLQEWQIEIIPTGTVP
jgi:ERCC4-type nuclease